MGAFDFIIALLSFVYALAMTHLLSRFGALVLARERVAFSGLQALAMLNAFVLVYVDWLTTWDARTLRDWDLLSITIFFVLAVANYLVCVAAAPDVAAEGHIDLGAFYWKNRTLFWGVVTGLNVLALPANAVFGKSQEPQLVLQTDLATLPSFSFAPWRYWPNSHGLNGLRESAFSRSPLASWSCSLAICIEDVIAILAASATSTFAPKLPGRRAASGRSSYDRCRPAADIGDVRFRVVHRCPFFVPRRASLDGLRCNSCLGQAGLTCANRSRRGRTACSDRDARVGGSLGDLIMRFASMAAVLTAGLLSPLTAVADGGSAPVTIGQMTLGYTYFNKPGADLQIHDRDVKDCAAEAARTIAFDEQFSVVVVGAPAEAAAGGAVAMALEGPLRQAYHRGAAGSAIENCMVVRGWRVVKLPDDEGQTLAKLAPSELSARLAPWVGASNPQGQVVRVWNNDADDSANSRFALRPDHTNDGQLSLIEATSQDLHQFDQPRQPGDVGPGTLDPKWPKSGLAPAALDSAPDGSAILIVKIKPAPIHVTLSMALLPMPSEASSPVNGSTILMSREGTSENAFLSRVDHAPDVIETDPWHGNVFAFAVPPGRWRISGIGKPMVLNFCLGAPSFEVKAGEVVYAGLFDLGAADVGPDLDLSPAKAWLAGRRQAETVRAAVYTNGSRGLCAGNAIYAFEVKGAPFATGYRWGGALPPASAATAVIPSDLAPAP